MFPSLIVCALIGHLLLTRASMGFGYKLGITRHGFHRLIVAHAALGILVPVLMPEAQRFTVWIAPGGARKVALEWNGDIVAETELTDGWNQLSFEVEDMDVGSNVLTIAAPVGPLVKSELLPPPDGRAGVAIGAIDVSFL